jgi:hypothetical protein
MKSTKRPRGRPFGSKNNPHRTPLPFTRRNVARAVRAALDAKIPIGSITVNPRTGTITITPGPLPPPDVGINPWDEVLKNEADKERTA